MCAPVFQKFMEEAVKKYGGGRFVVPPGGKFINIDRHNGARLPDDADGDNVVAEYFRDGEEPVFGVAFDGGFALGASLPNLDDLEETEEMQDPAFLEAGGRCAAGLGLAEPGDGRRNLGRWALLRMPARV